MLGAKETIMESARGSIDFPEQERRWIVARAFDFGRDRATYELESLVTLYENTHEGGRLDEIQALLGQGVALSKLKEESLY